MRPARDVVRQTRLISEVRVRTANKLITRRLAFASAPSTGQSVSLPVPVPGTIVLEQCSTSLVQLSIMSLALCECRRRHRRRGHRNGRIDCDGAMCTRTPARVYTMGADASRLLSARTLGKVRRPTCARRISYARHSRLPATERRCRCGCWPVLGGYCNAGAYFGIDIV